MKENEWLRFEKSGRVSDYLIYCQSDTGKYSEYETSRNMAENYSDCGTNRDNAENSSVQNVSE